MRTARKVMFWTVLVAAGVSLDLYLLHLVGTGVLR